MLATLVPQVTEALGGKAAWPDRSRPRSALITQSRGGPAGPPTVGGVLTSATRPTAAAYTALLSTPAVDAAATTVSRAAAAAISFAPHPRPPRSDRAAPATGGRARPTPNPAGVDCQDRPRTSPGRTDP